MAPTDLEVLEDSHAPPGLPLPELTDEPKGPTLTLDPKGGTANPLSPLSVDWWEPPPIGDPSKDVPGVPSQVPGPLAPGPPAGVPAATPPASPGNPEQHGAWKPGGPPFDLARGAVTPPGQALRATPEPGTAALLGVGLALLARRRG